MIRSRQTLKRALLLATLIVFSGAWLLMAGPAWAQEENAESTSVVQEFFNQPDLIAPLVVPMVLALGGLLTLMAFLGWILTRMPQNGDA